MASAIDCRIAAQSSTSESSSPATTVGRDAAVRQRPPSVPSGPTLKSRSIWSVNVVGTPKRSVSTPANVSALVGTRETRAGAKVRNIDRRTQASA